MSTVLNFKSQGDVTREDAQWRFLAQHRVQMLNNIAAIRNNVTTML